MPVTHPPLLYDKAPLIKSYMHNAHSLASVLLEHLTTHLDLPTGTLTALHDQRTISGDHVRFIKAPPQPSDDLRTAMGQHTDFGSVTILFNRVGGLQVLPPGSSEWCYVRPLPGHCIVNLGDAMVKFTNGLLRSNLHRVVAPPGEQVGCTRYALVYFARPGDEVPLRRVEGSSVIPLLGEGMVEEGLPSREHIKRMALGKRVNVKLDDIPAYLPGKRCDRGAQAGRDGELIS
jgi:isopenicillin N synthase-like dioxygenase